MSTQPPVRHPLGDPSLVEVADGIHAWVQPDGTWWVNNTGAVTGSDGTVVVDTCATDVRTRRFLGAVAEAVPGSPLRMAVNTHQHGDHTYGNSLLPAQTVLVGHENMREGLRVDPIIDGCPPVFEPLPDWGEIERRLPSVTFRDTATLYAGERRIELAHPGHPAHTTGDAVVWVPDCGVLFCGDLLFHGLTPLVFMGSVQGALRSLDWLAAYPASVVVPGHGPLVLAADLPRVLDEHERYFRLVLSAAAAGMASGGSPLECAQQTDLGPFAAWADEERLVLNLHRAYADARGVELDLMAAFADAVSYHHGPLATGV